MKPKCETDKHGIKRWYLNGKLHRKDGPAFEDAVGNKYWYSNGKLHRENGPAFENSFGDVQWWVNGKCHKEDGPAVIWCNRQKKWFLKEWYLNGKYHREDGPAIEWVNGTKYWYLNGERLTKEEFINHKRYCKICNNQLRHMRALDTDIFYCERCKR